MKLKSLKKDSPTSARSARCLGRSHQIHDDHRREPKQVVEGMTGEMRIEDVKNRMVLSERRTKLDKRRGRETVAIESCVRI